MKKINTFFALIMVSGFILSFSLGGFTTDYTGSTGLSGTSCGASNCHGGTMGVDTTLLDVKVIGSNNVDITKTTTGYILGATYNVEVKLFVGNKVRAGFQVVPLRFIVNTPAGNVINNVMPNLITITPDAAGRQYVSHESAGTNSSSVINNGFATWKFTWTAPTTNIGAIGFHAIGNVTNNDNNNTGDSCRIMTAVIQAPQISTSINQVNEPAELAVYPNPGQGIIHLKIDNSIQGGLVKVIDAFGRLVLSTPISSQVNTSSLNPGFYSIQVSTTNGIVAQTKWIKN